MYHSKIIVKDDHKYIISRIFYWIDTHVGPEFRHWGHDGYQAEPPKGRVLNEYNSWYGMINGNQIEFWFLFQKDKTLFEKRWINMQHIYFPFEAMSDGTPAREEDPEIREWLSSNLKKIDEPSKAGTELPKEWLLPLKNRYLIDNATYISFSDEQDAIHFKMRWC